MIHSLGNDAFGPTLARLHCGKNRFGIGIMPGSPSCGRNGEARRQILQAVIAVSRSRHWNLADVPGKSARSTQEPPAHDGPSTNSARHGQEKKIAASAGPKAILAPSRGLSIVQGQNGTAEVIG